ncbi:MAG: hypothetical protein ACYTEX_27170 [Planctomycetota bacterium]|jgi:hypothetical protein
MAVTAAIYGKAFLALANKEIDWEADTIKCALTTSSYSPDLDAHDYFDDVTNEVAGTGYTAGGDTIATGGGTATYTAAGNLFALDAANAVWTTSTITARYAVVYDSTPGSAATNPLVCYQNAGADVSTTAGTFTVAWAAAGIVQVTVGAEA